MNHTNLKVLSIAIAAVIMTGCATTKPVALVPQMTKLETELAAASNSAAQSLSSLAVTERAIVGKTQLDKVADYSNVPAGDNLYKVKSIKYVGPLQNLVGTISHDAGYNFSVIGKYPSVPVVVNVDVTNISALDILRNIGLQAGLRANVSVNPGTKVIEVAFAS